MIIQKFSNGVLLTTVKSKAAHERQLTVEIIELLQEVHKRLMCPQTFADISKRRIKKKKKSQQKVSFSQEE